MDDLVGEFVADVQEGYGRAIADLDAWARDPADAAALNGLFRYVHTVKGNAGFLAFERFERLCDGVERALADVRDGKRKADPKTIAGVTALMQRLGMLCEAIDAGVGLPAQDEPEMVRALGYAPLVRTRNQRAPEAPARTRTIRLSADQFAAIEAAIEAVAAGHRQLLGLITKVPANAVLAPAMAKLSTQLDEAAALVRATHELPVSKLLPALERIVAEAASDCGKAVRLDFSGGQAVVERELVDALRDPLMHIVRNAVDHGIEAADERSAARKPQQGKIAVSVRTERGSLVVTVADDGRGVDFEALPAAARIGAKQLCDTLVRPGFSTAGSNAPLSGLGVGLDAVAHTMARLGGTLQIDSRPGLGTVVTLKAPLERTMADAA